MRTRSQDEHNPFWGVAPKMEWTPLCKALGMTASSRLGPGFLRGLCRAHLPGRALKEAEAMLLPAGSIRCWRRCSLRSPSCLEGKSGWDVVQAPAQLLEASAWPSGPPASLGPLRAQDTARLPNAAQGAQGVLSQSARQACPLPSVPALQFPLLEAAAPPPSPGVLSGGL